MFAKTLPAFLVAAGLAFGFVPPAAAQEDQALSPKQVEAVRKIVKDYLMEHPETIHEAIEALRVKMQVQAEADAKKAIDAYKDELFDGKDDPIAGNPKGDVVLVEFFDYNCGYCKQTVDALFDSVKADGKVKVVFKEFPILTEESEVAAHVALAAKKQGKYEEIHRAFMKYRGRLDEKQMFRIAGESGLNVDQLKKDMVSADVDKQLRRTQEIAHALQINGTPSFVIGNRILSQALDPQEFKQLFDITRKGGKLTQ